MTEPSKMPYTEDYTNVNEPVRTEVADDMVIFELVNKTRLAKQNPDRPLITMARPARVKVWVEDDQLVIMADDVLILGMRSTNSFTLRVRSIDEVE